MRVQLWSYNYDPEPTGIAPLSTVWARAMAERGHEVEVVAAHPHYPEPRWGHRVLPYREDRDGLAVLRLPLWIGRGSAAQRIRQEASFAAALTAAAPFLGRPDVMVAVSPSFPALGPAMAAARARRIPWVLWLQDILPDGATATGILREGALVSAARRFERRAYRSAARVVVISDSFAENLRGKGVEEDRIARIYNPASKPVREAPRDGSSVDPGLVLTMGNIGFTQNLAAVATAFETSATLRERGARLVMAGDGVAADEVRAAVTTDRVEITGVLQDGELTPLLQRAALAVVSQRYEGIDFNVPSKLMNFMGQGIAVVAAVRGESEVARLVERSGGGWVTTREDLTDFTEAVESALADADACNERGAAALRFAQRHFTIDEVTRQFESVLSDVTGRT